MIQIATVPPYIPIDELPQHGGPERTKAYDLLRQKKLRAVKHGRLTLVTGESFAAYMAGLPVYQSAVSS